MIQVSWLILTLSVLTISYSNYPQSQCEQLPRREGRKGGHFNIYCPVHFSPTVGREGERTRSRLTCKDWILITARSPRSVDGNYLYYFHHVYVYMSIIVIVFLNRNKTWRISERWTRQSCWYTEWPGSPESHCPSSSSAPTERAPGSG